MPQRYFGKSNSHFVIDTCTELNFKLANFTCIRCVGFSCCVAMLCEQVNCLWKVTMGNMDGNLIRVTG